MPLTALARIEPSDLRHLAHRLATRISQTLMRAKYCQARFGGLARHISICLSDDMMENDVFKALADPTRRAIFAKLATGGMNASALREGMEMSQPAMSQQLAVLRNARLVREQRRGRFVNYEVDPDGLALIARWLMKYRAFWPRRIDALETLLKDMDQ